MLSAENNQEELLKNFIETQGEDIILSGSVIITIGTIIAALALTEVFITRSPQGAEGIVIGSGIESIGNVIQALGSQQLYAVEPSDAQAKIIKGDWLQAIGNAGTAIAVQEGIILYRYTFTDQGSRRDRAQMGEIPTEETPGQSVAQEQGVDEALKLTIAFDALSSAIQGTGAFISAQGISQLPPSPIQRDEGLASTLVGIGAFIEAYGAILALEEEELKGVLSQVIGAWIQVGASLIELNALTAKKSIQTIEKNAHSYGQYMNYVTN
ncbi:DUF6944 family repetitive protein [Bacillus testis]|uniref:DUF6944 family repetitive protein n=1 Tax=Bacillus testis TaxID=1622072 RepID=UPI00067E919D|nr:hypothetical protein [Bacillus testis]